MCTLQHCRPTEFRGIDTIARNRRGFETGCQIVSGIHLPPDSKRVQIPVHISTAMIQTFQLQQSAGIFNYLKDNVMLAIQQEPTPDMSPDTLGALSALMLAQAQEIFVYKAIHDSMKEGIIAKLAAQTEELYAEAMKLFQKEIFRSFWDKEWIPLVQFPTTTHVFHSINIS